MVGFDDVPLAGSTDPPLSTIAQPTEHKGGLAARALLDALRPSGWRPPTRTILPAELVLRGTTAPAIQRAVDRPTSR